MCMYMQITGKTRGRVVGEGEHKKIVYANPCDKYEEGDPLSQTMKWEPFTSL